MPSNYGRRLTEAQVIQVIADRDSGMSMRGVAAKHGVSVVCVFHIVHGAVWKNVPRPGDDDSTADMTDAELDAMIAERMPSMPGERELDRVPTVPHAVARGRGVQSRGRRIETA